MTAYYNENDPGAAAWLRELIKAQMIAPGDVDERSIEDVEPRELIGYRQCHFFAGIGGWSYALRLAGWPDDQPVWTGSCPCQPFSAAGKGAGFADERHLWPAWFHLIEEHGPDDIFGEQVASPDGLMWFDLVRADLEGAGYACGTVDICAAGVGAPHIRQRNWWVAHTDGWDARAKRIQRVWKQRQLKANGAALRLAESSIERRKGVNTLLQPRRSHEDRAQVAGGGEASELGHAGISRLSLGSITTDEQRAVRIEGTAFGEAEPVRGFWSGADWIYCTDGKYRPVEPGSFPLAHGLPARVGRLRGYGNAIVAEAGAAFVEACMTTI